MESRTISPALLRARSDENAGDTVMADQPTGTTFTNRAELRMGVGEDVTDGELLSRFLAGRDRAAEIAFAALAARHGSMVLRVCEQILANHDDALDAFQATFLVLVLKADSVRKRDSVASWLHGVALRVARRARADAALRRTFERRRAEMASAPVPDIDDARPGLSEEIDRLPEKFRQPVVLCYLEGLTTELAAQRLGCPKGTVLSRLARAKERLRVQLVRRGLAVPAALAGASLATPSAVALPTALLDSTTRAVMGLAASNGTASTVAATLARVALRAMLAAKIKLVAASLLVLGVAFAAAWGVHRRWVAMSPAAAAAAEPRRVAAGPIEPAEDETERRVADLKHIGLAMLSHEGGRLPASSIRGADGRPLLSWRVAILPLLGQDELFRQFRLDQPWDSPHNKSLISRIPEIYAPGGDPARSAGSTYYRTFVGPGTAFEGVRGISPSEITDGPSNTMMVVEAGDPVPWTRPDELPYELNRPLPRLGTFSRGGFLALFCNGEVRHVSAAVGDTKLRAAITRNGGELFTAAELGEAAR